MFYDTRHQAILPSCPPTGFNGDGNLVVGLDIADPVTQAQCGFVVIKSDTPPQPANTVEDVEARLVTIESDGVVIVRTWTPVPAAIPGSVSPRQLRLWLVTHGVSLASVDAAIAAIEDPVVREATQIEWEFSPYIERAHPMIGAIGAALGLSDTQIDQAFIEASGL